MTYTRTPSHAPIRRSPEPPRPPEKRAPYVPAGRARLEAVLRRYRDQLRPGSFEVLAAVEWADLHRVRDAKALDDEIRSRLARPDHRAYLVDRFDARLAPTPLVPFWEAPR